MKILDLLETYKTSDRLAMVCGTETLTYRKLWEKSESLAAYINDKCGADKTPVIVYGHKSPWMMVCFIACAKSGRAYVPVDTSVPKSRVEAIIDSVEPRMILASEKFTAYRDYFCCDVRRNTYHIDAKVSPEGYVKEEDIYYIIFTSGSTGVPKGVQITYGALNCFTEWALSLGQIEKRHKKIINQAPFSFDLSVMDLYMSLASESCLCALEKEAQQEYKSLFGRLAETDADVWVSTPSFADVCLADPSFNAELLPNLRLFLFCGETLTNKTVGALLERFPKAEVYNTYGPTESTVAVTEVKIDSKLNGQYQPLPVGRTKPGTQIQIMDGEKTVPEGEKGEIVISGNTVSAGYFKNQKENDRAFYVTEQDGSLLRSYRTGDKGYFKDGMLFYCGRIDLQIKLHGYRMELEDVEENLMKVPEVKKAAVVPVSDNGKVKYLKACCIYKDNIEDKRLEVKKVKAQMAKFVPDYMIPRKIIFVESIPMTNNGKVDRKKLQEIQ